MNDLFSYILVEIGNRLFYQRLADVKLLRKALAKGREIHNGVVQGKAVNFAHIVNSRGKDDAQHLLASLVRRDFV